MSRMIAILIACLWFNACTGDDTGKSKSSDIRQQAKEAIQSGAVAPAAPGADSDPKYANHVQFILPKAAMEAGATQCFDIKVAAFKDILAMQYTLNWDKNVLELVEAREFRLPSMTKENFGLSLAPEGKLTTVWIENSLRGAGVPDGSAIYQVCFKAVGKPGQASEIYVSGNPTAIEVVTVGDQVWGIQASRGKIEVK